MGIISSESDTQQGDPLGPLLFSKVVPAIAADCACSELLFQAWYMDDGITADPQLAVEKAL